MTSLSKAFDRGYKDVVKKAAPEMEKTAVSIPSTDELRKLFRYTGSAFKRPDDQNTLEQFGRRATEGLLAGPAVSVGYHNVAPEEYQMTDSSLNAALLGMGGGVAASELIPRLRNVQDMMDLNRKAMKMRPKIKRKVENLRQENINNNAVKGFMDHLRDNVSGSTTRTIKKETGEESVITTSDITKTFPEAPNPTSYDASKEYYSSIGMLPEHKALDKSIELRSILNRQLGEGIKDTSSDIGARGIAVQELSGQLDEVDDNVSNLYDFKEQYGLSGFGIDQGRRKGRQMAKDFIEKHDLPTE